MDRRLAHTVFFKLKDSTADAKVRLVAACEQYLSGHDGGVFFAAGVLAEEMNRDVNDQEFDVALLVVFRDKAAHDAYQVAPAHDEFIAENKDNWQQVRVFDADMLVGQGQP